MNKYLHWNNFLVPHCISYADIFLISMIRRGGLPIENAYLESNYKNVHRLVSFVRDYFACDAEKLYAQEERVFENIHNLTSSALFIQAVRKGDLDRAKQIAIDSPWAVNGREPHDQQLSAGHIAVKNNDFGLMEFLSTLPDISFDLGDADGETPLLYSISHKNFAMTKFLVSKDVQLDVRSRKRGWNPIYVAATLGTIECLEYLVQLGCEVNQPTYIRRTALTKACWMGREDSVKVLLKHPKINLEQKANSERTALTCAVWGPTGGKDGKKHGTNPRDSPVCVKLLLEAGADPMNPDVKGKTPLHTAC